MSNADPHRDEIRGVQRRIARELRRLTDARYISGQMVPPPPYVRRHLVEHAHAGGVLDNHTVPDQFLPYIDLPRLRELTAQQQSPDATTTNADKRLPLLPVLRRMSHFWDFA